MRLIHTADVHLDASFASGGMPPGFGNRRRQSLRDVFREILRRAAKWPADAVVIAGDLFEIERVTRDTLAFLRESFESIHPIPVFIAPGNHDPFAGGSPYVTETWPGNVHIFEGPVWSAYEVPQVPLTVHGFAFDSPDISSNPFGQLTAPRDGRIHVAVAHGSERAHQPPGKDIYAPFDASAAATDGLHYLALGHFHSVTPIEGDFATRMYYSGAPEGHGFNETGMRHYLEVEIAENGGVQVTPIPSSRMVYRVHTVDCGEFTNSGQILDVLRGLGHDGGSNQILRVVLQGLIQPSVQSALPAVRDAAAEDVGWLELVDETHPAEDYEELAKANTTLGAFVLRITQEIEDAPDAGTRAMLERARQVGLSAYRGRDLPIYGVEGELP